MPIRRLRKPGRADGAKDGQPVMNLEEAITSYETKSDSAKALVLGRLCLNLTLEFRSITLDVAVIQANLEKLQGINEIQHKALSQMLAHQCNRQESYSDRDFLLLLIKMAKNYQLGVAVQQALLNELQKKE